jgi:hypothetical protein
MSIRAFPNSFPLGNILHSCKEAPAIWSSGLFGDMAPYGMGLKVAFKCYTGLVFKGGIGDLSAVSLKMNCEERMFCNVYNGRINMLFKQVCSLKCVAHFWIGKLKPVEGVLEGLSGHISLGFSSAASFRHSVRECKRELGGGRGCKPVRECHSCA